MEPTQLNWITNFIWGIADDVLRDLYGEERSHALPRCDAPRGMIMIICCGAPYLIK